MRKLYWYVTAYIRKHGIVFFASVIGAIVLFSFLVPTMATTLEKRDRHYIGLVGEHTLTSLPQPILHQLSAGLTTIEPDGSIAPLLAERWSIEHEGKTYRFVLKENIFWQDGAPLRPEDIQYRLNEVETIITPNDIVFKLPDAYAPFPAIVSEPLLRQETERHWVFFQRPTLVGIGKYMLRDYTKKGGRLSEVIIDGETERFIYRFYLTETEAVNAYKRGEVDELPELLSRPDIADWNTTTVDSKMHTDRYLAVFFNINDPRFTKNIRQALSYATEKPEGERRRYGPIDPDSWAYLVGVKTYDYDLERGIERILDELPPQPLTITLTTTSLFEGEAEAFRQQWEAFGREAYQRCTSSGTIEDKTFCENVQISVTIKVTNFPDTSDFELLLIGQETPADPDQYHLWHSEQSTNFTGYKNIRIDSLLENGRQVFDQRERSEQYQEFQQFFLEDAPAIFIRHLETYSVTRK